MSLSADLADYINVYVNTATTFYNNSNVRLQLD